MITRDREYRDIACTCIGKRLYKSFGTFFGSSGIIDVAQMNDSGRVVFVHDVFNHLNGIVEPRTPIAYDRYFGIGRQLPGNDTIIDVIVTLDGPVIDCQSESGALGTRSNRKGVI